jgi:hypothetical protein
MRILKSLQTCFLKVKIPNGLQADNLGQNPVKRGIGLEVRILKGLREQIGAQKAKTPAGCWRSPSKITILRN